MTEIVQHIKGVMLTPLKRISTPHGDVLHALKSIDAGFAGFGEAYFSEIYSGDVKGWKRHNRMTLNLVVVVGKIRFVVYDDREGSETFRNFAVYDLSPNENYSRLTVEPGLWMAFEGLSEGTSLLLDIIPEPHDPTEADRKELSEVQFFN